ncbi:zinc finger domain-containing protein [Pseudomonas fluorescens]|uniref:Com family DNA-binding transcriptional regulator n=1 Tax=Pseudomonas fluorescens TaxID=294 RepID=A0A944DKS9_PSEFL|nr:Com family DNA-binding transcriptional regulator [Pseudomonas fluorescens]MBT2294569.1 Com family DNA-binding transcriptional regulator [Pseudomonas fluorescens]MBT2306775.1 Com family DNA-binding transcriptional regulator [Pseudomonas fluorescens]MBT2316315.1 Com family DNA-binding transcriptional regulator [Pseudomonas fluorescens]MBT2331652.1 Com family DNA-binding transcriptional regulator [Pseudomonas fluorescens]MBT2342820.1 Com family DNA-binding transcriptional regulator [Pseudomona
MMQEVRCGQCRRLLAKMLPPSEVQIKCPRCGAINHQKAVSLISQAPPSADDRGCHGKTTQSPRP